MSQTGPHSPEQDLDMLRSVAVHAGIIALGFFRRDYNVWTKGESSPVSDADIAVDRFLAQTLLAMRPDYGWLSEETADTPDRLDHARVFVIDPIDGTRGFIRGDDSWTISLAVVEHGQAIAGVVYCPVRDEMYCAARGHGATLNGAPLMRTRSTSPEPIIPAPMAVHSELGRSGLHYIRGPAFPSLAYRLVQVTTGGLDAAVARRGAQDWDIAGAAIILAEAGVDFEDVCAGAPRFNRPDVRHAALAATSDSSLQGLLRTALRKVYGCPDPLTSPSAMEQRER